MPTVEKRFERNPGPQEAFWASSARIIGYGGAFGGGKSRAFCEKALQYAMEWPGVQILVARQSHTSIVETTRKTWEQEVCPPELVRREKHSMGEDFWDLYTPEPGVYSRVNFIGLEDPARWFSAQIGVLIVDQAEECTEQDIVQLMSRLRDPKGPWAPYTGRLGVPAKELRQLVAEGRASCATEIPEKDTELVLANVVEYALPGKVLLSFNPANPDHWLRSWFWDGANETPYGFAKSELYATNADFPFGDAEFFKALATDNPKLAPGYIAGQLAGMSKLQRRHYLEGIWEYVSGKSFFDEEAIDWYRERLKVPRVVGETIGSLAAKPDPKDRIRVRPNANGRGPLAVWRPPVREQREDDGTLKPAHRYVLSIDVSSGGSHDNSGIQIIDVDEFAQVAEWQGKLDPDLVAIEAFRLGRIYNDALIVPEVTGGWGHTVVSKLEKLGYRRIYTRRVEDRIKKRWTDKLGWDTTARTRALMLDKLEEVLREQEFVLRGHRSFGELTTFVRNEKGKPEAQPGCRDDLVISLAIGVLMAATMPRQLRRVREEKHQPRFSATGY